jgi:hypothetical protein
MRIQELVKRINGYSYIADGIQQGLPFEVDFAGLDDENKDVLIITSGRLRFAEYVTRNDDGLWELFRGADSNIGTNGHDPATLAILSEDEADSIWIVLRQQVEEILEEVQE